VSFAIRFSVLFEEGGAIEDVSTCEAAEVLRVEHASDGGHTAAKDGLAALVARLLEQLLVVFGTVERTFELVAVTADESATTLFAAEVFCVHVLPLQDNEFALDGPQALGTHLLSSAKDGDALHVTINAQHILRDLLHFELLSSQLDTTRSTDEVLRMEIQRLRRGNVLVPDRVAAGFALVAEELVEVGFAIRLVILNHELASNEGLRTAHTNEVVGVVRLAESVHDLTDDHLTAISTGRPFVNDIASISSLGSQLNRFILLSGLLRGPVGAGTTRSDGDPRCTRTRGE